MNDASIRFKPFGKKKSKNKTKISSQSKKMKIIFNLIKILYVVSNFLLLTSCILLLQGCQGEQVQLAQLDYPEQLDLQDHSPVYLFFREIEIDTIVEVNRKNSIASTNWIFHVDKRFQMKHVVDELNKLQLKKDNSPHKRADAGNYFSFMDKSKNQLSFYDFSAVKYAYPNYFSTNYIKENPDYHMHFENYAIDFISTKLLTVNGFEMTLEDIETFIKETLLLTNNNKKALVYMNFNNQLSFEDYLKFWQFVKRFDASLIEISPVHFVYDAHQITDCGCR